jgi:hypothetical protein
LAHLYHRIAFPAIHRAEGDPLRLGIAAAAAAAVVLILLGGIAHAQMGAGRFCIVWPPSLPYGGPSPGSAWADTWLSLQPTEAERRMAAVNDFLVRANRP